MEECTEEETIVRYCSSASAANERVGTSSVASF